MRGIYRRGSIYWLARQVDKKRYFVSLETSDPVEALGRAEKSALKASWRPERFCVTLWNVTFAIAVDAENGLCPLNAAKDTT
jgi:hypothetical protein